MAVITIKPKDVVVPFSIDFVLNRHPAKAAGSKQPKPAPKPEAKEK